MGIESIVLYLMAVDDPVIEAMILNKWALAGIAMLDFLVCLFTTAEVMFSLFLRYKDMTRLDYRFRETDSNNSDFSDSDNISPRERHQTDLIDVFDYSINKLYQ